MDSPSPNSLTFTCPACQATLQVPAYLAGIKGPCPKCSSEITAPNPAEQSVADVAAPLPSATAAPPVQSPPPVADTLPPEIPAVAPSPAPVAPPVQPQPVAEAPPQVQPSPEEIFPPNVTREARADTILPPETAVPPPVAEAPKVPPPETPEPVWPEAAPVETPGFPPPVEQQQPQYAPPVESTPTPHAGFAPPVTEAPPVTAGEPLPAAGFGAPEAAQQPLVPQQKEKKRRGGIHPLLWILIGLLAVVSAVAAAIKLWPKDEPTMENAGSTPKAIMPAKPPVQPVGNPGQPEPNLRVPPPAAPAQPVNPTPPNGAGENTSTTEGAGAKAARATLDQFIASTSVEERMKFVQHPEKMRPKMEKYYSKHPLEITPTDLKFELSSQIPNGTGKFHVFQMTTPQQSTGFPVSVEETSNGTKIDWDSFVQFHDNSLGKFIKIYQHQAEEFYSVVELAHYFRTDVPDLGSKICLRVQPPFPGYEGYAFVEKDSPLAKIITEKFEWDQMYFPRLKLKWMRTKDGAQYIELVEVLSDSWRI